MGGTQPPVPALVFRTPGRNFGPLAPLYGGTRVFGTSADSAAQGSANAQFSLVLMYAVGRGVEVNEGRACELFAEAAARCRGPVWTAGLVLTSCTACCASCLRGGVSLPVELSF